MRSIRWLNKPRVFTIEHAKLFLKLSGPIFNLDGSVLLRMVSKEEDIVPESAGLITLKTIYHLRKAGSMASDMRLSIN